MPMLPDKPAAQSATVVGNFITLAGTIIGVIGGIIAGTQGWHDLWPVLVGGMGVIVAFVGYLVSAIGKRRTQGETLMELQKQTGELEKQTVLLTPGSSPKDFPPLKRP
jgi:hypothetical protein